MLAQRTSAHPSLLDLLRYCLEAWLPRFRYSPMTGIPVECNDVSRLVAHNYLKSVDSVFRGSPHCVYLRYVDDTVIFARSRRAATRFFRQHHLELRQLGLNPSSAKTQIMKVSDLQALRHRDVNVLLDHAKAERDVDALEDIADDWYGRDRHATVGWDKVTRKLYSLGRQLHTDILIPRVMDDLQRTPAVARQALYYLSRFDLAREHVQQLRGVADNRELDLAVSIEIGRCCVDARFPRQCSEALTTTALRQLRSSGDDRPGAGYLRALWLLVVFKHGERGDRAEALKDWRALDDPQWRLHAILVSIADEILSISEAARACLLADSDLQLMLRLCGAAKDGLVPNLERVLRSTVRTVNGERGVAGRHLPFLSIVVRSVSEPAVLVQWLEWARHRKGRAGIRDPVVLLRLARWQKLCW